MRVLRFVAPVLALACMPTAPVVVAPSPGCTTPSFWTADTPTRLAPQAFGRLPPERQARRPLSVSGGYELAARPPDVPADLDVYVAGGYPGGPREIRPVPSLGPGWEFVPDYSLIQYVGSPSPGPSDAITNEQDASRRADQIACSYGLLGGDMDSAWTKRDGNGLWQVAFVRRISGYRDYANKGLTVTFDASGRLRNILARRRPLLERTTYPTRSSDEAWTLARSGHWLTFFLNDGAPTTPVELDRFVVRSVEIAYVEGEVLSDRDIVRPYFVFRDASDNTLYVSAIAGDRP